MMFSGAKMLERKEWQKKPGASDVTLNRLASASPFPLPESYLESLAYSNGGEGPLSVQPGWLILDPAETVVETETCGNFHDFFPTSLCDWQQRSRGSDRDD